MFAPRIVKVGSDLVVCVVNLLDCYKVLISNRVKIMYFTHPYSSFEKGTNECHNKMLRRFIPKGRSIAGYSQEDIDYFADIINGLPRKILGYKTPDELFDRELDLIYADFGTA